MLNILYIIVLSLSTQLLADGVFGIHSSVDESVLEEYRSQTATASGHDFPSPLRRFRCSVIPTVYQTIDSFFGGTNNHRCLEFWTNYPESMLKTEGISDGTFLPNLDIKSDYSPLLASFGEYKIPEISHHIWLTDPNDPKLIPLEDLINLIQHAHILQVDSERWEHYLWVNLNQESIELMRSILVGWPNIKIVPLDRETRLSTEAMDQIKLLMAKKSIGQAVDILKYDVLRVFGGIVMDLNFELKKVPKKLMQHYQFFGTAFSYLHNGLLASVKNHPVLIETQALIRRNLSSQRPAYIDDLNNCLPYHPNGNSRSFLLSAIPTHAITAFPLAIAYKKYRSIPGNTDAIHIQLSKDLNCEATNKEICDEIDIGRDRFSYSWIKECAY